MLATAGKAAPTARVSAGGDDDAQGAPLRFGIYPGGGAGTVGPAGHTVPDSLPAQLAALRELRPAGAPFVVRLYASYSGPGSSSAADQVGSSIRAFAHAGFQIELVLTYRPTDDDPSADVPGFVAFVVGAVESFDDNQDFVFLQVTNEANISGAPNAADGAYAGAEDALVQGVIAAKRRADDDGADQVEVGFNWAYSLDAHETGFWRTLGDAGAPFVRSVDWVGLDVYPDTWGPRAAGDGLAAVMANTIGDALTTLRNRFMPLAHLTDSVALHITECGYPTGPGRTDAMQAAALRAAVTAVNAARSRLDVTDFSWFDLRDADSSSTSFESQYGLLRDDYAPKPAFAVYRELVARLSSGG